MFIHEYRYTRMYTATMTISLLNQLRTINPDQIRCAQDTHSQKSARYYIYYTQ